MRNNKPKGLLLAAGAVALIVLVGAAIAGATSGDEPAKGQKAVQEDTGGGGDSGEARDNEGREDAGQSEGREDRDGAGEAEGQDRDDAGEAEGNEGREDKAAEADEEVSGATADRARAAAVDAVGGGTASEVERGDDGDSGYEVEVERREGGSAEVRLDPGLKAVSIDKDD